MGEADRREAHGSRAAGPQVWGRDELEHRHGRWGPSIPTQPHPCARDTTTRCKQRRLPRPPGGRRAAGPAASGATGQGGCEACPHA